ncbi:hypothetical protein RHMOL_Rhmol03G0087900 [Rhododendron molle]|uniref:Uncharacterized protein n=2 Tax=Rhododendron molle TaxID=49168 RepID=A0ACC0PEC1_RHOML|nr:hypothetical protein RHMOL_Rhmol03G0087900 [Rhododendron molle]KAI8563114.1 hypothetical protein RHMOL_Rhmol03G0087900 [Rhododendron molle]
MDKWDRFMRKSKPIVKWRNRCNGRGEELQMLEQLRQGLVSFMQEAEVDKKAEMNPIFRMDQRFSSLLTELLLAHENHKQNLAVTPRLIVEVASPLTGFPASWLLCGLKPSLQDLESRLAESGEECGAGGLLTEAVKKRPFGVILLDNVDASHPAVTDLLIKILSHGRAKKYFKPELFEKLDEVIFFEALSYEQNRAVGRLQLRDIASSIAGRRLILYPSEAALREIVVRESVWPYNKVWDLWAAVILNFEGGKAMKVWLEENVVPVLFDILANNEIDDMLVVYIDALTGTKELSFRSEKRGTYLEDLFLMHFKESLKEFRIMYHKEKERVNKIYLLRRDFFTLLNLLNAKAVVDFTCVANTLQKLLNAVDDLISNAVDALFVLNECILETSSCSNEETEPLEKERPSKRPMNQVQGLCMLLANRVVGQNQAIDVVAEALLKSILPDDLSHRPTMSLLFLGLTSVGQADLKKKGFRPELPNQIDEIVCFNSFAREQLRKVARLSMRAGRHLTDGPPLALSTSILHLFNTASDPVFKRVPCALEYTVSFLAKGLINCGSNAH